MVARSKLVAYHPVHGYPIHPTQDLKTIKRNARERNRVETVNRSFETLRQHVPTALQYKKMSKVNIVHHALDYIHQLMYMLNAPQYSPNPVYSPELYHQFTRQQHIHYSPGSDIHSSNSFSHSSSPAVSSNLVSSSTHLWRQQQQLTSPAISCDSAYSQSSLYSPDSAYCSAASQRLHEPSVHSEQTADIVQKQVLDHLNLYNKVDLPSQTKLYNSEKISEMSQSKQYILEKICESKELKQYSSEEDDVLDAIVEWQSV